jgi:hypothetical protein
VRASVESTMIPFVMGSGGTSESSVPAAATRRICPEDAESYNPGSIFGGADYSSYPARTSPVS